MNLLDAIKRKLSQTIGGAVKAVKNIFQPKLVSPLPPAPKQPVYTPPKFTYASPKVQQASVVTPRISVPKPTLNLRPLQPVVKIQPPSLPTLPKLALPKISLPQISLQPIKNYFSPTISGERGFWGTPVAKALGKIQQFTQHPLTTKGPAGITLKQAITSLPQVAEEQWLKGGIVRENPLIPQAIKEPLAKAVQLGPAPFISGYTKATTAPLQNVPLPQKVGDVLGGVGQTLYPFKTMAFGAISPLLTGAINKIQGQPFLKGAVQSYQKGFEMGSKLAPIETVTAPLMAGLPAMPRLVTAAVRGGVPFGILGYTESAANEKERLKNTFVNLAQGALFSAGSEAVSMATNTIKNAVFGTVKTKLPQLSNDQATVITNRFIRDELGRFAGKRPAVEPKYYGDLRESLGLPRYGDYTRGEINLGAEVGIPKLSTQKTKLPPTPAEAIKPAPEKSVDELMGKLRFPTQEGTFDIGGKRIEQITPVQTIMSAIKEAKPTRETQEALYTKIRGQKIIAAEQIGQKLEGEVGFYKKLGVFKGEMPKVQFESIRDKVGQEVRDVLFNTIESSKSINEWDKLPAGKGLAKLFGEYGGQVPTRGELDLLDKVFGKEFTDAILTKRSRGEKLSDWFGQGISVPKSLLATADLSMPFRQAIFFIGRPKQFIPAFKEQFKYFFSEKALQQATEEIATRPTFQLMREGKVALTNLGTDLTKREEQYMSTWAEKIPVLGKLVRASSRGAVGFLNKLRADVFDDLYYNAERAGLDPANNSILLQNIANLINNGTGRGGLGPLERSAVVLNQALFSPRLVASRLNLLNPLFYLRLDPFTRKEALKTLFSTTSMLMTTLAIAKMGGAKVETDPRSADFSKIKVGNTRYEITGGFSQYIRLMAQLLSGKIVSSTTGREYTLGEGYKPLTRFDILQRFFEYKEAPILSFATELLRGQNVFGGKPEWGTEIANRFIPMVIQDTIDLVKDRGMAGLFMATPGIFGVGVQTYSEAESIKNMMSDKQKEKFNTYGDPYIEVISKNKDISYESGKLKKTYDENKPLTSDISLKSKAEFVFNQLKEAQSLLKYGKKEEASQIIDKLKKSGMWTKEVKDRVLVLDNADKQGLNMTDRQLLEYKPAARAIKIKEQLDDYKNPTNQTKKLKLLLDTGIIDSETKQELRKLYGNKGVGSKLKSVTPTPALKTGGIKVIPAEITKPTFKPQITEIKPPTPVNVTPAGGTVPSATELIKKYFPKEQWDNAYKVMMGESGGNPLAIGDNYPINGEIRPSYGLFQIRTFPDRPPPMQLLTPEANVAYAAKLWRSQGWRPWTAARKLGITR